MALYFTLRSKLLVLGEQHETGGLSSRFSWNNWKIQIIFCHMIGRLILQILINVLTYKNTLFGSFFRNMFFRDHQIDYCNRTVGADNFLIYSRLLNAFCQTLRAIYSFSLFSEYTCRSDTFRWIRTVKQSVIRANKLANLI